MIIFNIKVDKKSIFRILLGIMLIICIALSLVGAYMIFSNKTTLDIIQTEDCMPPSNQIAEIDPENYTNILQAVHKNIDTYIGQKIAFTRVCL